MAVGPLGEQPGCWGQTGGENRSPDDLQDLCSCCQLQPQSPAQPRE